MKLHTWLALFYAGKVHPCARKLLFTPSSVVCVAHPYLPELPHGITT